MPSVLPVLGHSVRLVRSVWILSNVANFCVVNCWFGWFRTDTVNVDNVEPALLALLPHHFPLILRW